MPNKFIAPPKEDMIVFSHLRWEFVFQRPQHIISRLAQKYRILFVEEPIEHASENEGTAQIRQVSRGITILQPRIDHEHLIQDLTPLIQRQIKTIHMKNPVLCFYPAAFQRISSHLDHSLIIYDYMDELSAFKGAPTSLIEQERILLQKDGIIFTNGMSLFKLKQQINANTDCFPNSSKREWRAN